MKTRIMTVWAALILVAAATIVRADEPTKKKPDATSKEFEQMKKMVGTWKGKVDIGSGPVDMTSEYRLISGGTVLEERVFPGTPQEMVTMYYDQNGKLAMTHYCMMGNRPAMKLKSSDEKSISFDFDATCGINPAKESHMHALSIRFDDADTVTMNCKALMDGNEMPEHPATLKRVKS
ncbi:hypothetical protein [Pedosphaera parvula]|uniref:DUF1579 domain-containing protein n=1 Tax=Pedosphaera parvula (strain Ellin514) TaxID=320771 RepID=B9XEA8_PEDPL|nr:hypothetical protein [Pedosphaera parvula]EEF61999.1 conserved hypothetical protein [Pedosphaera parvula Ellin514]